MKYLLLSLKCRVTNRLSNLLNIEILKINYIRFSLIIIMLELLSLNFILFIFLKSDDPCLKFFELLSTVIIIPILLSWLAELKSKTQKRKSNKETDNEETL